MKVDCPAKCGKRFISPEHASAHVKDAHPAWVEGAHARKGWVTPYGFVDFKEPVTYEEALETSKTLHEVFQARLADKEKSR